MSRSVTTGIVVTLSLLVMGTLPAGGVIVTYGGSSVLSGSSPWGMAPWLTTIVDDGNHQGSVTLTLSAPNLSGSEFVSEWCLRFAPALNVDDLVFSSPTKAGTFADPTISLGQDRFKAGPAKNLDIQFNFDVSGSGDGSKRFTAGDSITYTISGIPSLTAAALLNPESTSEAASVAHVQGIGSKGQFSGWISTGVPDIVVPEPVSLALLGLGCMTGLCRRVC